MGIFKFGDLEAEIDFTDADFLENLEEAKELLLEEAKKTPVIGKTADIIRAQCRCYFNFFDRIIGDGAHEAMFCGKTSLNLCIEAVETLKKFENADAERINGKYSEYTIQQHGNRQQRRSYNKQKNRKYSNNR